MYVIKEDVQTLLEQDLDSVIVKIVEVKETKQTRRNDI
jgi:hypothetical protein